MRSVARLTVPVILVFTGLGTVLPAEAAPSTTVVINEVDTRGSGGNDEFVELYNYGSEPVDLGGWALRRCNGADTLQTSQIDLTDATGVVVSAGRFPSGTALAPGQFLVVANRATGGFTGAYQFEYRFGITDHTGVQLVKPGDGGDEVVDKVGFSGTAATNACTDAVWAVNSGSNDNYTASRVNLRDGGDCAEAVDTDVNRVNFRLRPRTPGACNNTPLTTVPEQVLGTASVKISEVDTTGPAGGNDEFVELHNNAATGVDLTGWTLWRCNSADTDLVSEIVLSGSLGIIGGLSKAYTTHIGFVGTAAPVTYGIGVSDSTGVLLLNAEGQVVDSVGFSGDVTNNACVETAAATDPGAAGSATRLGAGVGTTGLVVDLNVNVVDFALASSRTPGTF